MKKHISFIFVHRGQLHLRGYLHWIQNCIIRSSKDLSELKTLFEQERILVCFQTSNGIVFDKYENHFKFPVINLDFVSNQF